MVLHESKCSCCGCQELAILRGPSFPPVGTTLATWLNTTRVVAEYEEDPNQIFGVTAGTDGEGPQTITAGLTTWADEVGSLPAWAFGGTTILDLGASEVTASGRWWPLGPRNDPAKQYFDYPTGQPPTGEELSSALFVSLYADESASAAVTLIQRQLPPGFSDVWQIGFDADNPTAGQGLSDTVLSEPAFATFERAAFARLEGPYIYSLYLVRPQAAVADVFAYDFATEDFAVTTSPVIVQAFYDLPQPEIHLDGQPLRIFPAHPGTPLSAFKSRPLTGLESVVVYTERVSLGQQFLFIDRPYWLVKESPSSSDLNTPPITVGFDGRQVLTIGENGRLINHFVYDQNFSLSLACAAVKPEEDELPLTGLFTAYVYRGAVSLAPTNVSGQYPVAFFQIVHEASRANAVAGYTNTTVRQFRGQKIKVYRDGVLVLDAVRPTEEQSRTATAEDGSYLIVEEIDDTINSAAPADPDPRSRRGEAFLKDYLSVVVDRVKPVVGYEVEDDIFEGDRIVFRAPIGFATEPVRRGPTYFAQPPLEYTEESDLELTARPAYATDYFRFADTGDVLLNDVPGRYADDSETGNKTLLAGTYELRFGNAGSWFLDNAGNAADEPPTFTVTSHPKPTPRRARGAKPTLENPGFQTREHWRPRLPDEPVTQLLLTFDRRVNASQVTDDQLTLRKDGEVVAGATLSPVGTDATTWVVSLANVEQEPRTFWTLEYNPAGVMTDDVVTHRTPVGGFRPEVGSYKTLYVVEALDQNGETQETFYSWSPTGFIEIEPGSPPLDEDGIPFHPEPCLLATRVSWLMADSNGYHRLIDTSFAPGPFLLGRTASVFESRQFDAAKVETTIVSNGAVYLPKSIGTFTPLTTTKTFTPSVPPQSLQGPTGPPAFWPSSEPATGPAETLYSYFGLTTTIDPQLPADVSCAAPSVEQKHASVIRCNTDISTITATFFSLVRSTGNPPDWSLATNRKWPGDIDLFPVDFQTDSEAATQNARKLLLKRQATLTFGKTLENATLSQNVWSCVEGGQNTTLPVELNQSRFGSPTCNDGRDQWFAVNYNYPLFQVSYDDLLTWEPVLRTNIDRDGVLIAGPAEVLPGDRDGTAGNLLPWWAFRKIAKSFPDDWVVSRNFDSGRIRRITSGTLEQTGLQAMLSAYRNCKRFLALKTTTLGELNLQLSLRMTIKATVNYQDLQLVPEGFVVQSLNAGVGEFGFTSPCDGLHAYDEDVMINQRGRVIPVLGLFDPANHEPGSMFTVQPPIQGLRAFANLDTATEIETKTVTHQFCADTEFAVVLSKEKEAALAAGAPVTVGIGWTTPFDTYVRLQAS